MQPGGGAEETEISSEVVEGGHPQGFHRLWEPPGYSDLLQIPGTFHLGGGRKLAGGGEELVPGKEGL